MRRVQENTGALRHHLEKGINQPLPDHSIIMAWVARWAAEFIFESPPGDDGNTRCEGIGRRTCLVPLVPFGEIAIYLPMEAATSSKGEPAMRVGVCLGVIGWIEATIIGTKGGVLKCG